MKFLQSAKKLMEIIIGALEEKKVSDPVVLDISQVTLIADYFIIGTGNTTTHLQSLGRHVEEKLVEQSIRPLRVEGYREGEWILLDCGEVVLHLFLPETRAYYNLERLWGDAEEVILPEE